MNLLLDMGNSRCKYAIADEQQIQKFGAISYAESDKFSEVAAYLSNLDQIEKVIISSVLDKLSNNKLIELIEKLSVDGYYFLRPDKDNFGITLTYTKPEHLGTDRLAVLIAANEKYNGNTCIIDCGSAITVDALSDKGKHYGGVIIPGVKTMLRSLSDNTELEWDTRSCNFNSLAINTQDAIYTGCLNAIAGGIQKTLDEMQKFIGEFDQCIITGGDAELVIPLLPLGLIHDPTMVLEGLRISSSKL